ncbi:hypothetical protein CYMTET_45906 [Cymbomonas tetramitiformis]|uniref:Reverse transcriptase domain-containing protein n=1 Tax=Cymbomonas tetramitiformis TaxID=36881 RepID=A0AAE0EY46_9CHLO|nr:hypothetical protein CYMTET_45906 [Cymbomonas tetramitiformis]
MATEQNGDAGGARSAANLRSCYSDLRVGLRMLGRTGPCTGERKSVAPALDRVINWANAAKANRIVELLKDGMIDGVFSASSMVKRTARGRGEKRSREEKDGDDEKEKNAQREEDLMEEDEEVNESIFGEADEDQPKKKQAGGHAGAQGCSRRSSQQTEHERTKARMDNFLKHALPGYKASAEKGDASLFSLRERAKSKSRRMVVPDPVTGELRSVSVPRMTKDEFLAQSMEMMDGMEVSVHFEYRKYVQWVMKLTERYAWADVYDFDAEVREDYAAGRVKSWCPNELGHRFQYQFVPMLGSGGEGSHQKSGKKSERDEKKKGTTGICEFFQKKDGCKKGKDCGWIHICKGCKSSDHGRWAQAAWGLPGAEEVVRGMATGFSWEQAEPDNFFAVDNYVPPEAMAKVTRKLQEEENAGRMSYSFMAKIDLKSAYKFVGVAAHLFRMQASKFEEVVTVNTRFPLGLRAAPGLFSDITHLMQKMLQRTGIPGVVVYLDDFLLVADTEADCQRGFKYLLELVEYLGFEGAPEKVEAPRQDIIFLGVHLQSNQFGLGVVSMSIDEDRVQRVASACRAMAALPKVRVKDAERIVGQLMFCARVVYGAKMFLRLWCSTGDL